MNTFHNRHGDPWGRVFAVCAFVLSCLIPALCAASPLDFTTFRLGSAPRVTLIIGGIQGDEPGGFSAATLLATRYEITEGAVWVVPNLNFPSIIRRSRGLHGDMNRKFAFLDEKDPEFATVRRIQDLIRRPEVGLVLNLHDGSGYYRPSYIDKKKNPKRWGQSIIIDQENLGNPAFMGNLDDSAQKAAASANEALIHPDHAIHIHNTHTAAGDPEMEKSLSYYAVRQGKAAFGIEASKELSLPQRTYYHLRMIEPLLRQAGVKFRRDFELTPSGVERALAENVGVSFAANRIFLPLEDARSSINYLPLPRGDAEAITSKPIMAVLPCEKNSAHLCVHYGNRTIALIKPDWREMDDSLDAVAIQVDGEEKLVSFGKIVDVREEAIIEKKPGYRVNAIGLDKGLEDESGLPLRRREFKSSYSLDKGGNLFRIEVYRGKSFSGMFLIRFQNTKKEAARKRRAVLPATAGRESSLGF